MPTLTHHVQTEDKAKSAADYAAGWITTSVTNAPRITAAVAAELRKRVTDMRSKSEDPTTWWHCDGNAWAAVTDLHRVGRHDEAVELAKLLHWCDQRFNARINGFWEIS